MGLFDYRKLRLFVVWAKLNQEIKRERKQGNPDPSRLTYLKKVRLSIKDVLAVYPTPQHATLKNT